MKKHLKTISATLAIAATAAITIHFLPPLAATLIISLLGFFLIIRRQTSHADLKAHLQQYENIANRLTSGKKADYVVPLALSGDEILGDAYNDLIKYVGERSAEIRKHQQMIDSVTKAIDAPLIIIGANGDIDYANNSFLKLVKRDSLANASYEKVKNKALRTFFQDALIRETVIKKEIHINEKFFESIAQPLFDENKEFSGVVILFHDVTELKTYENLQREFFTNASHELKTPITAIKGCVDILASQTAPANMEKEFLAIIAKENLRLEQLVKDLFLVNRFETNQISLEKEMINLNQLITNVIEQTETITELKNQSITFQSQAQFNLKADALRLEQCFLNLLTNAIHYSPIATHIEITIAQINNDIEIKMKDYGTGIPKQDLPHIFEKFYRVDRARARHSGGTGLGLAIVKSTIEAHGGSITVDSVEEIGTTFTIKLPI